MDHQGSPYLYLLRGLFSRSKTCVHPGLVRRTSDSEIDPASLPRAPSPPTAPAQSSITGFTCSNDERSSSSWPAYKLLKGGYRTGLTGMRLTTSRFRLLNTHSFNTLSIKCCQFEVTFEARSYIMLADQSCIILRYIKMQQSSTDVILYSNSSCSLGFSHE